MYIQLTERCNMTCAHCCMNATRKGEDMPRDVYMTALQLAIRYGEYVTLGGGEPTAHKDFLEYLDKALEFVHCGSLEEGSLLVITNGKLKTKTNKMLDMIEDDDAPFYLELSQDEFHDPIDPAIVRRFRRHQKIRENARWGGGSYHPRIGIRTVNTILPVGRAIKTGVSTVHESWQNCCCEDALIDPQGRVWSCGCKHTQIGTVWDRDVLTNYDREFAHTGGFAPEEMQEAA